MPYDNGSSPPDDIAAAAGEVLTEIGAAPPENGGGTSATATASSLGETARVLLASPSTHPERRGSDFFPLAREETAHGQDLESSALYLIYGEFIRVQAVCLEFGIVCAESKGHFAPGFAFLCSNGGGINYAMP